MADPFPVLDLYDIAWLAGGLPRVLDTAIVAMVESGRVRVQAPGQLAVADPTRGHPVEAAVLDAVGTRGHRSVDTIRWRLGDDDRVRDVGRRLIAAGLVSRWSALVRRGDRPPLLTAAGRRALRGSQSLADPVLDGGSAVLVARYGRERIPDALLRAAIFEAFPRPSAKSRAAGIRRRLDAAGEYHPGGPVGGGGDAGGALGGGDGGGGG